MWLLPLWQKTRPVWGNCDGTIPKRSKLGSRPAEEHTGPIIPKHPQSTKLFSIYLKRRTLIGPNEPAGQTLKEASCLGLWLESVQALGNLSKCCDELLHAVATLWLGAFDLTTNNAHHWRRASDVRYVN
jgi:hypothetical protein